MNSLQSAVSSSQEEQIGRKGEMGKRGNRRQGASPLFFHPLPLFSSPFVPFRHFTFSPVLLASFIYPAGSTRYESRTALVRLPRECRAVA